MTWRGCCRTCPSWRPCGTSPTGSTGCSTRRRTITRRVAAGRRSWATRPFRAVPELVKALEQVSEEKFPKIMAYLQSPVEPAGADEQPCGANQPDGPVPGEGALQVAAAADAGPVRRAAAGPHLGSGHRPGRGEEIRAGPPATRQAAADPATASSSRLRIWWCSARSLKFSGRAFLTPCAEARPMSVGSAAVGRGDARSRSGGLCRLLTSSSPAATCRTGRPRSLGPA